MHTSWWECSESANGEDGEDADADEWSQGNEHERVCMFVAMPPEALERQMHVDL